MGDIIGVIVGGIVVGGLGRLILPGRQPIGCLLTVLIGVVGATLGWWIGDALDVGGVIRFIFQVLVAAGLVALFVTIVHGRRREF